MANDLQNVNLPKLAQESLPAAVETFAPLNAFTTDFSPAIASSGASIGTRYVDALVGSNMAAGYVAAKEDVTYVPVTIPLDTWKGFTIGFTDLERSKAEFNLFDDFMVPGLEVCGSLMMTYVWNLVTAANFSASKVVTAANYDRDIVADLGGELTDLKNIKTGRSIVHNTSYYTSIVKSLNTAENPGMTADKTEAIAPRVAKFDLYESTLADSNSQNLAAFACQKSAICIAARSILVDDRVTAAGVSTATMIVPGLNLPVQLREWYDPNVGIQYLNMNVLWGAVRGKPTAGKRILSA